MHYFLILPHNGVHESVKEWEKNTSEEENVHKQEQNITQVTWNAQEGRITI